MTTHCTADAVRPRARITRSVLLGADTHEEPQADDGRTRLGIGPDVVLERVIVYEDGRIGAGCRLGVQLPDFPVINCRLIRSIFPPPQVSTRFL